MCDYSLMMIPNRLAIEGEELVAYRFQSGSIGLVSCSDFNTWQAQRRAKGFWQRLRTCFSAATEPTPVVCIPPGARLRLERLAEFLKGEFHLRSSEDVTFTQLSAEANRNRDALCFDNGAVVPLGSLTEGQKVKILGLPSSEDGEPAVQRPEVVYTA